MATRDRNFDPGDVETPAPRFVTRHPAVFVLLIYVVMVVFAVVFLQGLGAAQNNPDDPRNLSAAIIFAVLFAALLVPSFFWAFRRPRLPGYPRR